MDFNYLYSKEKCKELDLLLKEIAESENLYEINIENINDINVKNVFILFQNGLLKDVPNPNPNSNSNVKYYKLSSPYDLGSNFYRNGGFIGERNIKEQMFKDKISDRNLKIWAIVASIISGSLIGAIVNLLF
jgi:hypothetical protein